MQSVQDGCLHWSVVSDADLIRRRPPATWNVAARRLEAHEIPLATVDTPRADKFTEAGYITFPAPAALLAFVSIYKNTKYRSVRPIIDVINFETINSLCHTTVIPIGKLDSKASMRH